MRTPKEKYQNDPEYRRLVKTLEGLIEEARFTPSELREACLLASINYEMRHVRENQIDPVELRVTDDLNSASFEEGLTDSDVQELYEDMYWTFKEALNNVR